CNRAAVDRHNHASLTPRSQSAYSGEYKTKLTGEVAHKLALRRDTPGRFATNAHRRSVETDERRFESIAPPVKNIDRLRGRFAASMRDDCVDPGLQWCASAPDSTGKVVTGSGRKNTECR